jgi:four helix bundle protein
VEVAVFESEEWRVESEEVTEPEDSPDERPPATRQLPYRRLEVWQKAMDLAMAIAELVGERQVVRDRFVRDQILRSAMSVAANLAEGHGRGTVRDFSAFVDRARGSLFETDTWIEFIRRSNPGQKARLDQISESILELNAMMFSLRTSLRRRAQTQNQR